MKNNTIAIDIGSSNTTIYKLGAGIVLCEATCIALSGEDYQYVKAVGNEAKKLVGKTIDHTEVVWPVEEGEIEDENALILLVSKFMEMINVKKFKAKPDVILAIPCGSENSVIRKYERVLNAVGLYDISFVETPILTALGMNAPITEFNTCFFIDIGGGITTFSAVSLDGIIVGANVNMGGKNIDAMLIDYIEEKFQVIIGTISAENLKMQVGSLSKNDTIQTTVFGRSVLNGKPCSLVLSAQDIIEPIEVFFDKVISIGEKVLGKLPAEVSADIKRAGIYFSGGSSKIAGLDVFIQERTHMCANVCEEPIYSCAFGGGVLAGKRNLLDKLKIQMK